MARGVTKVTTVVKLWETVKHRIIFVLGIIMSIVLAANYLISEHQRDCQAAFNNKIQEGLVAQQNTDRVFNRTVINIMDAKSPEEADRIRQAYIQSIRNALANEKPLPNPNQSFC